MQDFGSGDGGSNPPGSIDADAAVITQFIARLPGGRSSMAAGPAESRSSGMFSQANGKAMESDATGIYTIACRKHIS